MSSRTQELASLYRGWDTSPPPPGAIDAARRGILDALGCIVAGAATLTAAKVRDLAAGQGRVEEATVFGTDVRLSAPLAALANGVAGHVLDFDDMSSTLVGHPSVVLVPSLLALAEARGSPGREFVSAYILGFEVDMWLARLMVPRHYDAGWHSTSTIGIFGAAAGACRLLRLDAGGMVNALAIAASKAAGLRANFGSMTKALHAGDAAEGGLRAALLSARGFGANAAALDAFIGTYGANPDAKAPPEGRLEISSSGIGIKPYPCCGAGVSLIDAALDLAAAHRPRLQDIVAVDCTVSEMAVRIMPFHAAADGLQARYSLEYCAAVALLDGRAGLAQFDDGRVRRADVQELTGRVRVTPSAAMASGGGRFGVELTVRLADGSSRSTRLEMPRGHPGRPLGDEGLLAKFMDCAAGCVGEARAREAAGLLHRIETLPNLQPLTALLRKEP